MRTMKPGTRLKFGMLNRFIIGICVGVISRFLPQIDEPGFWIGMAAVAVLILSSMAEGADI